MDLERMLDLLLGNLGTLVLLALLLAGIFKRYVVPGPYYEASERRNQLLEAENRELNGTVKELTAELSDQRVELATLQAEVGYLRREVAVLQHGGA